MPLFGRKKRQEEPPQQKIKEVSSDTKIRTPSSQIYIKASPLNDLSDIDGIKEEVSTGNIVILKITPLARKSFDDTKKAIHELSEFVVGIDGDIARLGEERIVVTPSGVKIWREKTARSSV